MCVWIVVSIVVLCSFPSFLLLLLVLIAYMLVDKDGVYAMTVDMVETGVRGAKVKTVEYLQCVWFVERLSVHRAIAARQT